MAAENFTAGDDTKAKPAKSGGSTNPKPTASTPVTAQLGRVIQFPKKRPIQNNLVEKLEVLLSKAQTGEICSMAYLIEYQDNSHAYGMVGAYLEHPDAMFIPACKSLFGLCKFINDNGFEI